MALEELRVCTPCCRKHFLRLGKTAKEEGQEQVFTVCGDCEEVQTSGDQLKTSLFVCEQLCAMRKPLTSKVAHTGWRAQESGAQVHERIYRLWIHGLQILFQTRSRGSGCHFSKRLSCVLVARSWMIYQSLQGEGQIGCQQGR